MHIAQKSKKDRFILFFWLKDICLCFIILEPITCLCGVENLGYRDFVKDYKIEYEDVPGRKRPKATRVYVGPWYRFTEPAGKIRFLKWYYLIGMAVIALLLLIPFAVK